MYIQLYSLIIKYSYKKRTFYKGLYNIEMNSINYGYYYFINNNYNNKYLLIKSFTKFFRPVIKL